MIFTLTLHRRLAGLGLATLACLLLAAPAEAQWKWRDSRGQIHISDIPPPRDIPDKDVLQRAEAVRKSASPPPAAASSVAVATTPGKAPVDPELEERKRKTEQEQAARLKADEKKLKAAREENCSRAREQLATLDSGMRVMRVKPDGEREYMTDEQRSTEAQRARDLIGRECR